MPQSGISQQLFFCSSNTVNLFFDLLGWILVVSVSPFPSFLKILRGRDPVDGACRNHAAVLAGT